MSTLPVACLQMTSGDDEAANLETIRRLVGRAVEEGARFVTLPENCLLMPAPGDAARHPVHPMDAHPGITACAALAAERGVWILLGSVAVAGGEGGRRFNRAVLLTPEGRVATHYDKLHLFDVTLAGGEEYRESARFAPGGRAVIADVDDWKLGLTICYDLRFPYLHRALAQRGAQALAIPAAFTYLTGTAHWHVLLRARAIETGSYVLAAAQVGVHPGGRRTYGHALIVSPWGEVLADAGPDGEGVIHATMDAARVAEARGTIPNLATDVALRWE